MTNPDPTRPFDTYDWAAVCTFADYFLVADWPRGSPCPTATTLAGALRDVRVELEAAAQVEDDLTGLAFGVARGATHHWLVVVHRDDPAWRPSDRTGWCN